MRITVIASTAFRDVRRRARSNVWTAASIALGAASIVSILGVAQGSAVQISSRVQSIGSSAVAFSLPSEAWALTDGQVSERMQQVTGVLSAGIFIEPEEGQSQARLSRPQVGLEGSNYPVVVATSDGLAARGVTVVAGGVLSNLVSNADTRSILIGSAVARDLQVNVALLPETMVLEGRTVAVVGVLNDNEDAALSSGAVILTPQSAVYFGLRPARPVVLATSDPYLLRHVATYGALALWPTGSDEVGVGVPPSVDALAGDISADTRDLVLLMAIVVSVAAAFSIITTMRTAVWQRRAEIGVRRSLGASRRDIAFGFLLESSLIGAAGSLVGLSLGGLAVGTIAFVSSIPLVLPATVLLTPILGLVVGALAGIVPAIQAGGVDPMTLIRA